ncbi:MAG: YbjQ family protein [Methanobacterium sp.]
MLLSIKNHLTKNRWGYTAIIIGTLLGFISAVLCVRLNLVIFGFNVMFIISPLIAGFSEAYIARKKHGKSTGAISALLIFIIINIYGWFFPKDPITLNLFTLGGIALTIQAAVPILVNYLLFVVFVGTITYVIGLLGNFLARITGKPVSVPEEPKSPDIPQMELLFTSVPLVEGKNIKKHFGTISAESIVKDDEEKSSLLDKIIPKKSNGLVYKLGKARNEALKNLEDMAKEMGANAVLNVTMNYESIGGLKGATMVVTVTGNAVLY